MAIFSYRMGDRVSRGAGQSAVKVAAYQARERFQDERTGYRYNSLPQARSGIAEAAAYIDREDGYDQGRKAALFVGLYAPSGAPDWCRGRENIEQFWSKAELAERRQDAQIAERIIIALPHELTLQQNIWLLQDHVKEFTRQGRVVQVAIHEPEHSGPGAEKNVHAHLLVSIRGVDERGFRPTKYEARERYLHRREYVTDLRAKWADATNRHLARHGHEARIDHRTLAEQGIDRAPTIHLGPGDSRRERQGERSAAGEVNREIGERNGERQRQSIDRAHEEQHRKAPVAQHTHESSPESARQPKADRAPEMPAPAPTASGGQETGRRGRKMVDLFRTAFETAHAWLAPPIADPHQQPIVQPPPQQERVAPQKSWAEMLRERAELEDRTGSRAPERSQDGERANSPLYERYKAERDAAYQAREAAVQEVYAAFAAYAQDLRGFYNLRFVQEKHSGLPGPVRHDAMELLSAQRRGDKVQVQMLRDEQIADAKRANPVPDWGGWLRREAEKGDKEAGKALARHEAREAERNRDRGDDGRGIEPG